MSLLCRSSWILPFSKGSTSLTTEGTYNQSFVPLGSIGPSVGVHVSFVFLPSYLPSFMHSLNWVPRCPCFAWAVEFFLSVRLQLLLQRKVHHSINHSFWARSVSQSLFCSSSFLPSFKWVPRYPCFAGAVEFLLSVGVQLLLQRKAHQSIKRSMNEWINQSMDQSIDKSKPKRVLPIILRTAEECFFLKPFLRKRPSKRL